MTHLKDEKGYALVTVLLIIVVFMVISLSFMGQSFNSVKQNRVVEKNYQSVALAEMGISYYQLAVRNAYLSNQEGIVSQTQHQLETDRRNRVENTSEYYTGIIVSLMKQAIQSSLENEHQTLKIENRPDATYIIQDVNITSESNDIIITFTSLGEEEDETSKLSAEMKIPIKDLGSTDGEGSESDPSNANKLPDFNQIQEPKGIPDRCKNPPIIYDSCSEIFLAGSGSFSSNYNNLDDKLLYAKGALMLGGNANNMSNTQIHTDGSMSMGKNMNNARNVFIEVKGATSFGGQLRMDRSQVFAGGSMSVAGHLEVEDKSIIYVGGSAAVSKHLSIGSNSKMCVAGNLGASQLDIDGELYVKGSVSGKVKSGQVTQVNHAEFEKNCGVPNSSPELNVEWGDIVNKVEYSY
jgi:competence protein ComGC/cytoskeletal protein CcmA (bactofilin family)